MKPSVRFKALIMAVPLNVTMVPQGLWQNDDETTRLQVPQNQRLY